MVEVDGLPRVEHDRPRPARMALARADEAVQSRAQPVEPFVRPRRVDPRRRVLLARLHHHLTELRGAQDRRAVGQPLRPPRRVAAPGQVDAPHLAAPEPEPLRAGDQQQRRVMSRPPVPRLPQPDPLVERPPLRMPLPAPPPGEIQHLRGHIRHREDARELVQPDRLVPVIAQHLPQPKHPRRVEPVLRHNKGGLTPLCYYSSRLWYYRGVRPPLECWAASPALGSGWGEGEGDRDVEGGSREGWLQRRGEGRRVVGEGGAPMDDLAAVVDDDRDAAGRQVLHQATGCAECRTASASPVSGSKQCSAVKSTASSTSPVGSGRLPSTLAVNIARSSPANSLPSSSL